MIEADELKVVTEMEMDLSSYSGQAAIGAQFSLVQGTLTTSIDSGLFKGKKEISY